MAHDHYQLVTISDGKSDAAAIMQIFTGIFDGRLKGDVRLLNYCNEVPVSYAATVKSVASDSVELSIHEHQAQLLKQSNSTLIRSRHFDKGLGVHAYAAYVNVAKQAVILHNFAYAQVKAERREAVRVRVGGALPVQFFCDHIVITGAMIDISANGVSILASSPLPATVEGAGLLSFNLLDTPLTMPATFVRAKSTEGNQQMAIFTIAPDRITDAVIGKFIYQRQVEVISALKEGLYMD